jgi:hypothetical protein
MISAMNTTSPVEGEENGALDEMVCLFEALEEDVAQDLSSVSKILKLEKGNLLF